MQRQKVFFFAVRIEGSDTIADLEDLKKMAINYVHLYGESCLNDPETPSFVRHLLARKPEVELPRAG